MVKTDTDELETPAFQQHAEQILQRLRSRFAGIIEAVPGRPSRPSDVSKTLGIDKQLGWKVSRLVRSSQPFVAAQHIPGSAAVRIFLNAARKHGVPPALIESAKAAMKEFDRLVDMHAGDRASLEMMLSSCAEQGRERVDLGHRRAVFRGNSYIWGVQAKTQLTTGLVHPASEEGRLDLASLRGFIGLRRIRANVPWVVGRTRSSDESDLVRRPVIREPVDPPDESASDYGGVPLLREFCTKPLPKFRRIAGPYEFLEDELVEGPVGNTGAITCIISEVARAAGPHYRHEHKQFEGMVAEMRTPCKVLISDQIVHEDVFGRMDPELVVWGELNRLEPYLTTDPNPFRLPVSETVEYLGKGPSVLHTPDVPRYAEMARYVFDRLGWDGERFDVYRVRMPFPPIPTAVVMRHELPERPSP